MRITIDRALFDARSAREATALVRLLSRAADDTREHALLTEPLYAVGEDNGEIDTWFAGRNSFEASAFRTLLINGILTAAGTRSPPSSHPSTPRCWHIPGPLEIRVERRPESDWRNRVLTVEDAAELLDEPVHLLLEDVKTDLAFVGLLAGSTNNATLQKLLNRAGRIERHGGGGGQSKRWLRDLTSGSPTAAKWRRMLRAWVLFDQDAGHPNAFTPSAHAVELMNACEDVVAQFGDGLSWICFRRREIESYVPDSALRALKAEKKAFVDQVIDWRADAQLAPWAWALDLKNGLHGDLRTDLPQPARQALKANPALLAAQMLKDPFSSLSAQQIATLSSGVGEVLRKVLREGTSPSWASDLPAEYDRGPVDQVPRDAFVQSLFDRM